MNILLQALQTNTNVEAVHEGKQPLKHDVCNDTVLDVHALNRKADKLFKCENCKSSYHSKFVATITISQFYFYH